MKNNRLDIFIEVKEEILSKAYIIGTKYFEYIKGSSIISSMSEHVYHSEKLKFECVNVKLEPRGCHINLEDKMSDYGDILESFYLTYEEIFNPNILEELIDQYKNSKKEKED